MRGLRRLLFAALLLAAITWPAGASAKPPPPKNTSPPTISGQAVSGATLTATTGSWSGQVTSYGYQWRRCDSSGAACTDLAGATASTYLLGDADVGATMRVAVTASSPSGSTVAVSAATGVVQPPPTPPTNAAPPTISGTAEQYQRLTAAPGTWNGTPPFTYAYAWLRCDGGGAACGAIAGASASTYVLTASDVDHTVRVTVTATNGGGSADATSAPTAVVAAAPQTGDPVVAAAGDIACDPSSSSFNGGSGTSTSCRQGATSDLLLGMSLSAVLALGDIQYECGGYTAFLQSYDLSWGRIKNLTFPVPGNREYSATYAGGTDCDGTGTASGYFRYFGAVAGDPAKGYYSFDVGTWHVIALNSNCSAVGGCGVGSAQEQWLKNDLALHPAACTLAYWHHPRFSSGTTSGTSSVAAFWNDLYAAGAELVLNGHAHDYERFDPQSPSGAADPAAGIREIVVGTGGKSLSGFSTTLPNSVVRNSETYGVLQLTLHPFGYDWTFVPVAGSTFTDSGSAACH